MKETVVLGIPCFRCEKQIARVIQRLTPSLLDRIDQVLLVDNRSPDRTVESAQEAIAGHARSNQFRLLHNHDNYGLGGSHKIIFARALAMRSDYVAILHGDDQGKPDELHDLLDATEADAALDAVLGARFHPRARLEGYSKTRTIGNLALNALYTGLSGRVTLDLGSGLNLFRTSIFEDGRYRGFSDQFTFNMDLLLHLYRTRARTRFVPITWSETDQVSNAKALKVGWMALKTALAWRFGISKGSSQDHREYGSEELPPPA